MSLIRDSIPDWVWPVVIVLAAISFLFKWRAHRRTLVEAASAPGAGYDEQEALKKQTIGGVGMAVLLGGIGLAYILPKPYGLITLAAGIGGCWLCVFVIRRTQQPPA